MKYETFLHEVIQQQLNSDAVRWRYSVATRVYIQFELFSRVEQFYELYHIGGKWQFLRKFCNTNEVISYCLGSYMGRHFHGESLRAADQVGVETTYTNDIITMSMMRFMSLMDFT
jgi:hypothetical protein